MSELWYLFWHMSLAVVVFMVVVAALIAFVMVKILAGAQSSVINEGYLGFDESDRSSTTGDEKATQ